MKIDLQQAPDREQDLAHVLPRRSLGKVLVYSSQFTPDLNLLGPESVENIHESKCRSLRTERLLEADQCAELLRSILLALLQLTNVDHFVVLEFLQRIIIQGYFCGVGHVTKKEEEKSSTVGDRGDIVISRYFQQRLQDRLHPILRCNKESELSCVPVVVILQLSTKTLGVEGKSKYVKTEMLVLV